MYTVKVRKTNRDKRKVKIRSRVYGTAEKPRLTVFRSNKYIYAQLINDATGKTLVDISAEVKDLHKGKAKIEGAKAAGALLAKKAVESKIKEAAFDRNGYRFHGRVKALADAAREGGLKL